MTIPVKVFYCDNCKTFYFEFIKAIEELRENCRCGSILKYKGTISATMEKYGYTIPYQELRKLKP